MDMKRSWDFLKVRMFPQFLVASGAVMGSFTTATQGVRPLVFSIVLSLLLLVFCWVLVSFRTAEEG